MVAFGSEMVRPAAVVVALGAVACAFMAVMAMVSSRPDDVPRGVPPALPGMEMALWGVAAIVLGTVALIAWTVAPEDSWEDEGLEI